MRSNSVANSVIRILVTFCTYILKIQSIGNRAIGQSPIGLNTDTCMCLQHTHTKQASMRVRTIRDLGAVRLPFN